MSIYALFCVRKKERRRSLFRMHHTGRFVFGCRYSERFSVTNRSITLCMVVSSAA